MDAAEAPLIFLFAGEVSGDDRGAEMARALKALFPGVRLIGVAGPKMRAEGVECLIPMEEFQVMGFIDVFFALPRIFRLFRRVKKAIKAHDPDAIVTIDYPGFNLRLAKSLWKQGHRAKRVHYVCPSVWAHGKKRIPLMAQVFDHLVTILPFEKQFFKNTTLSISYAGHPLLLQKKARNPEKICAIFPGSRAKEIERNLPLQIAAAKTTGYRTVISCASPSKLALIQSLAQGCEISMGSDLMETASFAIATSGTITLELALAGVPTVVTYAITPLDTFIVTKILRINMRYYALPNIIAQKEVFPEHFGPACTLDSVTQSVQRVQEKSAHYTRLCDEVAQSLGPPPTDASIGNPILKLIINKIRV